MKELTLAEAIKALKEGKAIDFLDRKDNEIWKECINLPFFRKDEMYKGMEANKEYTLEELGL